MAAFALASAWIGAHAQHAMTAVTTPAPELGVTNVGHQVLEGLFSGGESPPPWRPLAKLPLWAGARAGRVSRAGGAVRLAPLPRGVRSMPAAPPPHLISSPRDLAVPILMYHALGTPPAGEPYPSLFVTVADFVAQMRYLAANHYTAVTLGRVVAFWHGHANLPARPVVLSFDDGYRSDWRVAMPILQRLGWPGVLDLCLNNVRDRSLGPRLVTALVRRGWEVDDHSLTHPDMTALDASQLRRETAVSRRDLQRLTGQRVAFFCYPAGRFDARVVAALKRAGFRGATTELPGLARPGDSAFALHRVRVPYGMPMTDFAAALGSG
ncbi:MAG TPA: polysaccharide deacetylase family protein [Thermoleophilia bacterium]|nr:polysaccharide deacetylase family protein [Thermoleophilia bacterium]